MTPTSIESSDALLRLIAAAMNASHQQHHQQQYEAMDDMDEMNSTLSSSMQEVQPTAHGSDVLKTCKESTEFNDPNYIAYVCDTCGHTFTQIDLMHMHAKNIHACPSCHSLELQIIHTVNTIIAVKSLLSISMYDNTCECREDQSASEKMDIACIELLTKIYPKDDSDTDKKDCALPYCDGVCKKVKCCKNGHYLHADCMFNHIMHSDAEICPVCRERFMMLMFYRLDRIDMHKTTHFTTSPYNRNNLVKCK